MFMSIFLIYLYLNKKNRGFFFLLISFQLAIVDNYRKYQAVNFFKVTMVTFNDLHPLTNL